MARPAGYSSDEEFRDDGLSLSNSETIKKRYVPQEEKLDTTLRKEEMLLSEIINRDFDEVRKYIEEGAEINYKSPKHGHWTPLMHACSQGKVEIIKYLLDKGASTEEHHELITPLLCLCDSRNRNEDELIECLDLLIDYGADVNVTDWFKTNALVYAIKQHREKLVIKLLNIGCNKESSDSDGWTPIFYAVDEGCLGIVQILKDAGANIKKVDLRGRSLYDIAQAKHHKEIAEIVNVAEKVVDIDDIIDSSKDDYKRMSNYEFVMSNLPNKNKGRFYGFHRDAIKWIYGIGLSSLVKLLLEKNVQLNEILTMDEEHMKELGIILSYDRKKLKYCVQKLHEHSWGKNSLKTPSEEEINLNITAQLLCNIIQQVHICSASTYFWRQNMGQKQISNNEKTYIDKGLYYIKFIEKEKNTILKIVKEIENQDKIIPSDLIVHNERKQYSKFKRIIPSIILSVLIFKILKPNIMSIKSKLM
uniref:SAM domain-containing protein n=1 Tax=Riptortus pedestris TaxID=329032 RepID=R4WDL9_RIPPE|nr:conserved hypothetical protein [Riptortus pedestris]